MMKKTLLYISILQFLIVYSVEAQDDAYLHLIVGIHFDSNLSGGHYTPEKLVQMGIAQKLDAIVFCDHDRMEVEYGLQPFESIVKKKLIEKSLHTYGFKNYIELMTLLDRRYPEITVIHGCETGPGYYWDGSVLNKDLTLHNWHQHMMVIGLETPEAYANIPSTSAKIYGERTTGYIFALLVAGGIIVGLLLTRLAVKRTVVFNGQKMRVSKKPFKLIGYILSFVCLLYLINDYPFEKWRYSPYDGPQNIAASQAVIDHALATNALVYFSHPEGEYSASFGPVNIHTDPYTGLLKSSRNYTGFAVFGEGWKRAGQPAGEWDEILLEYCQGKREKPVWIIGETDFEGDLPAEFYREVTTFVWAKDKSKAAILDALCNGRNYCSQIWGPKFIFLDNWSITDDHNNNAISGETLEVNGAVKLHLNFTVLQEDKDFEVKIIRNGVLLNSEEFNQSSEFIIEDTPPAGIFYYRLWVLKRGYPILASNPIFINRL